MDEETREFFEWADGAGIETTKEAILCWKAGRQSMMPKINSLRQESRRLAEIIREKNHEMGIG